MKALSLVHLNRPPLAPSAGPPPLLLLLHGVGSHEGDLMGLAPYLDPRFFIVSARAPLVLGPGMYGWFEVRLDPYHPVINPEQAEHSRQLLIRFIEELAPAYGTDPRRVFLLGFSQGAIMSLSVLLTRPDLLAGVVAMSGRLLPEVRPLVVPPERLRDVPVLVIHGTADQVLPVHHGRAIRDFLAALPVRLTYREYPMGHEVTEESLADVAAWLREQLDRPER
ncbi:MAG TPA: phospholipase [bacterium]|nr:phospholipase [bacterium]